ncbi:cytochrome b/b6 domain-containing protein [Methylocystis sp. WRRC1]|uniref:cytochrome b/b6 domain-containing protein n=1 Tax=Methylocystis sp. WRRC1 TaxID=1732014 RepID=UPI00210830DF|nr:cytochrome b/b6 domain-containing protein [Methylocystis sp. WRRC1]
MKAEAREFESVAGATVHPLALRMLHWTTAFAVIVMILSGWRIYNASPLFPFVFPVGFTLGGWLAGALAWHFAAMWLLAGSLLAYLAYGIFTGHFRRRLWPFSPGAIWRDFQKVLAGRGHVPGSYNAAQRAAYVLAFLAIAVAILSGLAIWKPVQLQELTAAMGGFETARRIHFFAMSALFLFIVVHVSFACGVKGVLKPMITGRLEAPQ